MFYLQRTREINEVRVSRTRNSPSRSLQVGIQRRGQRDRELGGTTQPLEGCLREENLLSKLEKDDRSFRRYFTAETDRRALRDRYNGG